MLTIRSFQFPNHVFLQIMFLQTLKLDRCAPMLYTVKNTVISPNFLVWKFCSKARFLHGFGRLARNYAETLPFNKISTPENQVKLRYFLQWYSLIILDVIIVKRYSGQYFPAFGLNTEISVFSPNAGKYRPEKLRIWTLFTQWQAGVINIFWDSIQFQMPIFVAFGSVTDVTL